MYTPSDGRSDRSDPLNEALSVLSNPIRRGLLATIAADEPGTETALEPADLVEVDIERERLETQLRHSHLPILDEAAFIDWNRQANTLTPGPRFQDIQPMLELLDEHQHRLPGTWP